MEVIIFHWAVIFSRSGRHSLAFVNMTLNMPGSGGAPKIKKNASRKNKKSWRKNVDMTEVEEYLEEKRFEERIGKKV